MSTALLDAQQQTRDYTPPPGPAACGLWIVARDQVSLYESLRHAYRDSWKIAVLLDRRQGDRRWAVQPVPEERRRRGRRRLPSLAHDLHLWGYVLVRPYPPQATRLMRDSQPHAARRL
jgi:hypothetical protein